MIINGYLPAPSLCLIFQPTTFFQQSMFACPICYHFWWRQHYFGHFELKKILQIRHMTSSYRIFNKLSKNVLLLPILLVSKFKIICIHIWHFSHLLFSRFNMGHLRERSFTTAQIQNYFVPQHCVQQKFGIPTKNQQLISYPNIP